MFDLKNQQQEEGDNNWITSNWRHTSNSREANNSREVNNCWEARNSREGSNSKGSSHGRDSRDETTKVRTYQQQARQQHKKQLKQQGTPSISGILTTSGMPKEELFQQ
jgi:hypothetical protein